RGIAGCGDPSAVWFFRQKNKTAVIQIRPFVKELLTASGMETSRRLGEFPLIGPFSEPILFMKDRPVRQYFQRPHPLVMHLLIPTSRQREYLRQIHFEGKRSISLFTPNTIVFNPSTVHHPIPR